MIPPHPGDPEHLPGPSVTTGSTQQAGSVNVSVPGASGDIHITYAGAPAPPADVRPAAPRAIPRLGMFSRLRHLLATLDADLGSRCRWEFDALRGLHEDLLGYSSPEAAAADRLLDGLLLVLQSTELLATLHPTTVQLRRSAAALSRAPLAQATDLRDRWWEGNWSEILESIVFGRGSGRRGARARLTLFMADLADQTGNALDSPELRAWAETIDAGRQFNDAVQVCRERRSQLRLRLVISFHGSITGAWPETLHAWLLDDDDQLGHADFECRTADQRGNEAAYAEAVRWGKQKARSRRESLEIVDVALPARLLLQWRPEEVRYGPQAPESAGGPRVGAGHYVVARWSEHLYPADHLWWIDDHAIDCLREMSRAAFETPVEWLAEEAVADRQKVKSLLASRSSAQALGLSPGPGEDDQLLELLLAYHPVLLWADRDVHLDHDGQQVVQNSWYELPLGFTVAYRSRWKGEGTVLAGLRAAWHDEAWLTFCHRNRAGQS